MHTTSDQFLLLAGRYLRISIGPRVYGVSERRVCALSYLNQTRAVSGVLPHVRGVIYCGNRAVPVFDLRQRFNISGRYRENAPIVVFRARAASVPSLPFGLLVDDVKPVVNVEARQFHPAEPAHHALPILIGVVGPLDAVIDLDSVATIGWQPLEKRRASRHGLILPARRAAAGSCSSAAIA